MRTATHRSDARRPLLSALLALLLLVDRCPPAGAFEARVEGSLIVELAHDDSEGADERWARDGGAALWRVDGGAWQSSGAELDGLAQGTHAVEFQELAGWDEPRPFEVFVSGVGATTVSGEYALRPTFVVGEIPPQIVRHGERATFGVDAPDGGAVTAELAAPAPLGELSFEAGLLRYVPDIADVRDFDVVFSASDVLGEPVRQVVTFSPQPRLEPESSFVDYRFQSPDDESDAYVSVTVEPADQTDPPFNDSPELDRLRSVTISGKTVVLGPGHASNLYERFSWRPLVPVKDIRSMTIHAETLVIAAPTRFPQADLTVFAREIRFEGDGSLSVVGLDMSRAGTMKVFAREVTADGDGARFLTGATEPVEIESLEGFEPCGRSYSPSVTVLLERIPLNFSIPANKPAYFVRMVVTVFGSSHADIVLCDQTDELLELRNGFAAASPLAHANLDSNLDLASIGHLESRFSLTFYRFVQRFNIDFFGVVYTLTNEGQFEGTTQVDLATQGSFTQLDAPLAWAHPFLIKAAIAHARDAYLVGNPEVARRVVDEYLPVLDEMLGIGEVPLPVPQPLQDVSGELETVRAELVALEQRLDSGLDYFGNPAGWVPMLSFEVNFEAFRNEIESAVRTLYLTTWLGQKGDTIESQVAAMTEMRARTVVELEDMRAEHTVKKDRLPGLRSALGRVADRIASLRDDLMEIQEELEERARENVEERNKLPWWKRALRGAAAITELIPIPGVKDIVAGTVGAGLDALSRIDEPGGPRGFEEFFTEQFDERVQKYSDYVDAIDPDVNVGGDPSENWGQDVVNDAQEVLRCQLEPVKDLRRAITNKHAPASEVEAELERIRATDPRFNAVVRGIRAAVTERGRLAGELDETVQRIAELSVNIVQAISAIVELNRNLELNLAVLDHRTLQAIKDIERRVKDRLLWYQYLTAKAFQYRLVRPYDSVDGANFLLGELFDEFVALGQFDEEDGHELSSAQVDALVAIYEEELDKITAHILDDLNSNPAERHDSFTFGLGAAELETLNTVGEIRLNMVERGLFFADRESLRLVNINTEILDVSPVGGSYGETALLTVGFEHGGVSRLRRGGETYAFHHLRGESSTPPSWDTSYDGIVDTTSETTLSSASQSLLARLLGIPAGDGTLLYLRPAADADIVIRKQVILGGGSATDMRIDRLQVRVDYDFHRKPANHVDLTVAASDGFRPTFLVSREDVNGRRDGRGEFVRVYNRGERVRVEAPEGFGLYAFDRWVDGSGALVSSEREHEVVLDASTRLRAVYMPVSSTGGDTTFRRGDANFDDAVNISDAQYLLNFLFLGGPEPACFDAADTNDDGAANISDAQFLLNHLFLGGPPPLPPFPGPGADTTSDGLACRGS